MWDWCGYFGEAGDLCLKVEKVKKEYVVKTNDGREYPLKEGVLRCIFPYGICVELRKEGERWKAQLWNLGFQEKAGEVEVK